MSHQAFKLIRRQTISALKIECQEYVHIATGAKHFHFASDDTNNAFLVAFQTIPEDSAGVAHILEHTSLCGSKRYPVRDPFFMMTRRSLNTFMNAFTSSDWTAYPFATQSKKDFNNLLGVYLDATFFPNLNELDFLQEGHRLEFEEPENSNTPLQYKGIVFNEMKGAMSSPTQRIWQDLQSALFTENTYHYNSGGEPRDIPDLTHQDLLDFHAKHYHPSNANFMTYGNFPVEEHQAQFEEHVLKQFEQQSFDLKIDSQERFTSPIEVTTSYALEASPEEAKHKSHVVISWLLGESSDLNAAMDAQMLSGALLDNSASPLRRALETTDLGSAPSDLCGVEDSTKEGIFVCGLEGCDADDTPKVKALILNVLEDVAKNGVPQSQLESILHQVELSQREAGGGHFPYGLQLMVKALSPTLHGADTFAVLDIDPVLARLHEKIKDPDYIPALVKKLLLDNNHRVLLTAKADITLNEQQNKLEKEKLTSIQESLSESDKEHIIAQTQKLQERQESVDDPELLPSVSISDAADELNIPSFNAIEVSDIPVGFYPTATNGITYQHLIVTVPKLTKELTDILPLYCDCLNEVGVAELDYLETQQLQASISGGVSASLSCRSPLGDLQAINCYMVISGKALMRNQEAFAQLIKDTFDNARFDEHTRLRELVAQISAYRESSITQSGHRLAMQAASSGSSPYASISHQWDGLEGTKQIIILNEALNDEAKLKELADNFKLLQEILIKAPKQFLLINEDQSIDTVQQTLNKLWEKSTPSNTTDTLAIDFTPEIVRDAWTISTQVNFCAKSYLTVSSSHEDSAALVVLGNFLRNGYLHRTIREQGGAYGGGATYMADSGTFRFFSYRDPRFAETLNDFDESLQWLANSTHESNAIEEAILGVISDIDRPDSPAGEARSAWYANLHGRTAETRKAFRKSIMQVTLADLQRVAKTWLKPENASIAVITNSAMLEQYNKNNPALTLKERPIK